MTYIETISGRRFSLQFPDPDAVHIPDIAHSLSLLNRFVGHTTRGYSVAEHSLWAWLIVEKEFPRDYLLQLHALLHDAHEAYTGDVSGPLRMLLPDVAELSLMIDVAIYRHLGIALPTVAESAYLHEVDRRLRTTERRCPALMPNTSDANWPNEKVPYQEVLDGTWVLEPVKLSPSWPGPSRFRFPLGVALQDPPDASTPRGFVPMFGTGLAFLYEHNLRRLLALVKGATP